MFAGLDREGVILFFSQKGGTPPNFAEYLAKGRFFFGNRKTEGSLTVDE